MARPHQNMTRRYADELKLFRSRAAKAWLVVLVALWLLTPMFMTDPFWLSVLNYAGIAAIGAIGLNILTGYTGQVSLGHAFFIGAGAYVAAAVGGDLGLPLVLWLPAAALFGAGVGALIGPFALRLRGPYLAIVTLGLVFLGEHLFRNMEGLTGGNSGTSVTAGATLGPIDFNAVTILGDEYIRNQGWFWLVWGLVALCALLAKNIVRTRPGRAIQAIRDRDGAAGICGAVLGALFLGGLPAVIENYSDSIPGVATTAADDGFISVFSLNQAIFGLLIVLFLMFEPRGLAAMWLRLKAYFKAWPFSY